MVDTIDNFSLHTLPLFGCNCCDFANDCLVGLWMRGVGKDKMD
jgi:hypothetical protein